MHSSVWRQGRTKEGPQRQEQGKEGDERTQLGHLCLQYDQDCQWACGACTFLNAHMSQVRAICNVACSKSAIPEGTVERGADTSAALHKDKEAAVLRALKKLSSNNLLGGMERPVVTVHKGEVPVPTCKSTQQQLPWNRVSGGPTLTFTVTLTLAFVITYTYSL